MASSTEGPAVPGMVVLQEASSAESDASSATCSLPHPVRQPPTPTIYKAEEHLG